MRVGYTFFSRVDAPSGHRHLTEWGALVARFEHCARAPHDGRALAFAHFAGDYRKLANVDGVFALGLDIDDGSATVGDAAAFWDGHLGLVHNTKSSTLDHPRIRIVLPYSRSVSADEHYRCWRWAAEKMGNVDVATKDPSRLWFLPSQPKVGPSAVIPMWGPSLDVEKVLEESPPEPVVVVDDVDHNNGLRGRRVRRARAWLARAEPAVSGQSGHGRTFRVAGKIVRGFDLDPSTALELLSEWNRSCVPPWSMRDLKRKVHEALRCSDVPRGEMLEANR